MIIDDLRSRAIARAERYDIEYRKIKTERDLPSDGIYVKGVYSLTQVNGGYKRKRIVVVDQKNLIDFGNGIVETPTAVARDYLRVGGFRSARLRAGARYYDYIRHPNYAKCGTNFDDGVYIDLRAAYYSIMQIVGWDCVYHCGRYLVRGRSVADFPFAENKIARNTIATSAEKKDKLTRIENGKIKLVRSWNENTNLHIVTAISDVLFALARLAIDGGAVYVNTDGYIFTSMNEGEKMIQRIADFGLSARVKLRGAGAVGTMQSYQVGDHRAGGYGKLSIESNLSGRERVGDLGDLSLSQIIWLQRQFDYIAGGGDG